MTILGIESSCDETSAAVWHDGKILSNIISSQFVHRQYGGVVPELASRAHQRLIVPVVDEALSIARMKMRDLTGIAVTFGPGLIGALLVGVNFAKAMAYGLKIPVVGVNHLEAHLYSNLIEDPKPTFPFLCLLVSGGHTQLILVKSLFEHELLGETLDDAAGEAFDKVAKMLGLGFPGGPLIDKLAVSGNPNFVKFPRSYLDDSNFEFSFSGIKTSMLYWLRDHGYSSRDGIPTIIEPQLLADLCASFQASVVDVLLKKIGTAVKKYGIRDVAIAGGVSANSELQRRARELGKKHEFRLFMPRFEYCTDNAAMIALVGSLKLSRGILSTIELNASASVSL
jgi:N6-L-threonylcarbamoyladenine synthase